MESVGYTYSTFPRPGPSHDRNPLAGSDGEGDVGENIRAIRIVSNSYIPELYLPPSRPIERYPEPAGFAVIVVISRFGEWVV